VKVAGMEITDENSADPAFTKALDEMFYADLKNKVLIESFSLAALRKKYKDLTWNKLKFESAFALKYSGPDSLVKNIHYSKVEMYNTLALPLGKSTTTHCGWGQFLLGLNLSSGIGDSVRTIADSAFIIKDTVKYNYTNASLAGRIYAGSNNFKAFVEGSCNYGSSELLKTSINGGAEFNIRDGIWGTLSFGNNWVKAMNDENSHWKSDWYWKLSFRFHLPESKKI
jgi:hypothetical protein